MTSESITTVAASLEYLEYSGSASMIMFLLIMGITAVMNRKDPQI